MKYIVALLTPALLFLAAACGSADDPSPTTTATPPGSTGTLTPAETPVPTETAVPASPTPEPASPTPPAPSPTPVNTGSSAPFDFPSDPDPALEAALLVDVRTGAHDGFDRIVFEFEDVRPAGRIEYVEEAAHCGTGEAVTDLAGDAILLVNFDLTNAHTEEGEATLDEHELDGPGNTLAEARQICDFEAQVTWVLGVAGGELPFGVYLLQSPTRIVIDIYTP